MRITVGNSGAHLGDPSCVVAMAVPGGTQVDDNLWAITLTGARVLRGLTSYRRMADLVLPGGFSG